MTRHHCGGPFPDCAGRGPQARRVADRGLTLVEMLVAISITLLIMASVVTVFANVSSSVTRRRATIEMASTLRNVRETLAADLAGATCPAVPWQRAEANVGYLELIEGPQTDYYPSPWLYDADGDGVGDPLGAALGIDLALSTLPGSNLGPDEDPTDNVEGEGRGLLLGANQQLPEEVKTDGRGLGDADDTLMLTVRNEREPFVGRIPSRRDLTGSTVEVSPSAVDGLPGPRVGFQNWPFEEVESPLAEVAWFAVENPRERDNARTFSFGEPGYRTIHRRTLLIMPSLDYRWVVRGEVAAPGTVWVLPEQNSQGNATERVDVATALASLIAFQERYDLSVRLEWDPVLPTAAGRGRWVLKANTLADLTKRENRFEHHGYAVTPAGVPKPADNPDPAPATDRYFPFAALSGGDYAPGTVPLQFRADAVFGPPATSADFDALAVDSNGRRPVVAFQPTAADVAADVLSADRRYKHRPFVRINQSSAVAGTARAILNEEGNVVHVTAGLAPLGGTRRGDDVMMTDALAFDLRAYDPGAPVYSYYAGGVTANTRPNHLVEPGDPSWLAAYQGDVAASGVGFDPAVPPVNPPDPTPRDPNPAPSAAYPFLYQRQGAFVDLGYRRRHQTLIAGTDYLKILATERFVPGAVTDFAPAAGLSLVEPRFFASGEVNTSVGAAEVRRSTLYATYDTWPTHYETNGVNEDIDKQDGSAFDLAADPIGDSHPDEGTNGLDDAALYPDGVDTRLGPDDPAERETRPPYDSALRGLQVSLRAYERDSRQVREVRVRESFVPE